jgi:hypothetical protein
MRRLVIVLLLLIGADHAFGKDFFVTHNGSLMLLQSVPTDGEASTVTISYFRPSPKMERVGVSKGTLFFEGFWTEEGNIPQVSGTARVFKRGCDPLNYQVAGSFRFQRHALKEIKLAGAAPTYMEDSCSPGGYTLNRNSQLVFKGVSALDDMASVGPAAGAEWIYKVSGVAQNDVLHVRSEPSNDAQIIAFIPPNTVGIARGNCRGQWCQILWFPQNGDRVPSMEAVQGWVNARYLKPHQPCNGPCVTE